MARARSHGDAADARPEVVARTGRTPHLRAAHLDRPARMKIVVIADSGERTRLACWRWRPRHNELSLGAYDRSRLQCRFGAAPNRARDGACAPQSDQ